MKWRTITAGAVVLGVAVMAHQLAGAQGRQGGQGPGPGQAAAAPPAQGPNFQHWDDAKLSKATYKVKIELNVKVPMRDGVKLSADIYRPEADGKFPAVLLRTPYSNNANDEIADSKWFAERGYVVVNEDVRGRYDSGGDFYAYKNEANDGFDTDEWIGKQPWNNGKIGTIGGSYLGYTQVTQGVRNSKYLTSIAAELTSTDIHQGWTYVDGAFHLGFALPWGAGSIDGHTSMTGPQVNYEHLPIMTADETMARNNEHYRDWLKHPNRNDPYWNNISFEREAQKISVPYLAIAGWFDIFLRGQLNDHAAIMKGSSKAAKDGKRLMIGPWVHAKNAGSRYNGQQLAATGFDHRIDFGPDAEMNRRYLYLRWNDYWLKGIDNGVATEPPVTIFVMGENKWRREKEWPLARTQYTKYYIQATGKANTSNGTGVLSTTVPAGGSATDTYTYDPAAAVPSLGGNVCCSSVPSGPRDHSRLETRDDVLVYTTPALTSAVEVTGPIKAKLFASTLAKDTDWIVRLVDVYPDGYAQNVQDGIIRARYRAGMDKPPALIEPGKITEFDIDMWASSNVFLPGHRIRIEVTSSNFPRFDRNLNTGEDPATGTKMEKAQQTIYHSAQYPSHVVLPIIAR